MIDLTVYPDRPHHHEPKETTMNENLPYWANDPRGLPPVIFDGKGNMWQLEDDGCYLLPGNGHRTPAQVEAAHPPITPLWPDTKPAEAVVDRETIAEQIVKTLTGWALNRTTISRTDAETMASALVNIIPAAVTPEPTAPELPDLSRWHPVPVGAVIPAETRYAYVIPEGDWHMSTMSLELVQEEGSHPRWTEQPLTAPDPDRDLIDAILAADDPDVARTLLGTIRGEQ